MSSTPNPGAGMSVNIPDAVLATAFPVASTFALSDGRIVKMRKAKGRDLISAGRYAVGKNDNDAQYKLMFAMVAQVILVNDLPIALRDIEDMDLSDVLLIQSEYTKLHPGIAVDSDVKQSPTMEVELNSSSS